MNEWQGQMKGELDKRMNETDKTNSGVSESGMQGVGGGHRPLSMGRSAMVVILVALVGCAAAEISLRKMGYEGQVKWNRWGAGVCAVVGLISLLPVWGLSFRSLSAGAMGFMVGMTIRILLCGLVVLVGGKRLGAQAGHDFAMWVAGWYLVMLVTDVMVVGRYLTSKGAGVVDKGLKSKTQETQAC